MAHQYYIAFLVLLCTVVGIDWSETYEEFVENPYTNAVYDPNLALAMHVLSGAAYEFNDNILSSCIHPMTYYTVKTNFNGDETRGYVGYLPPDSERRGMILIFFHGTKGKVQLFHEWLKSNDQDFEGVDKAKVVRYFDRVSADFWPQIRMHTQSLMETCPTCGIMLTGHSLGGAVATLTLARFLRDGMLDGSSDVNLYTFGAPRAGNKDFANWFNSFNLPVFRIVHHRDLVPHLPCCRMTLTFKCRNDPNHFSPWHVQTEVYYNGDFSSYRTCSGSPHGEDLKCANSNSGIHLSVDDHLSYFGIRTSTMCQNILHDLVLHRTHAYSDFNLTSIGWPKFC